MSVANPVIDYVNPLIKRIFLKDGVREYHPVTDIYTEIRNLRRLDESLRPYDMPISAFGNVPKGGGKFTSRYAQFNQGWKVVPANETHALYVSGEQITDDGQSGPACIDVSLLDPGVSVTIHYEPPASELVRADEEIQAIAKASYMGMVVYDETNGVPGVALGTGTYARPSNNFNDAKTIAQMHGLQTIMFAPGVYVLPPDLSLDNMILRGINAANVLLILESGVSLTNSDLIDVTVTGTLSGTTILRNCYVFDLEYFSGFLFQSQLAGWITIAGPMPASIMSCYGAVNGIEIDLQNAGHSLVLSDFSGDVRFINKTCTCPVKVYMNAGCITLDPSVINGAGFHLDGVGHLKNEAGVVVENNRLVSTVSIANEVMETAEQTPIHANVRRINNAEVLGNGTSGDLWRGHV
jgi:hypothetical protein